jgi:hypothetical protein
MHKIFTTIRTWFSEFFLTEVSDDPVSHMSPQELADLPIYHPRRDWHLSP